MKKREKTEATKSRRAITHADSQKLHAASPIGGLAGLHLARRAFAGDRHEGVVQAGPLDRQLLDPRLAGEQRLEQGLDPRLWAARTSSDRPRSRASFGQRAAPFAVGGARS